VDAESGLRSVEVQTFLSQYHIVLISAPDGLGFMSLPTDQRAHSVIKRYFYRLLMARARGDHKKLTPIEKFQLWREAFWSLSEATVRYYFRRTGLTAAEPVADVVDRLFSEGQRISESFFPFHSKQLLAYLEWRVQCRKPPKAEILRSQYILSGGPFWPIFKIFI